MSHRDKIFIANTLHQKYLVPYGTKHQIRMVFSINIFSLREINLFNICNYSGCNLATCNKTKEKSKKSWEISIQQQKYYTTNYYSLSFPAKERDKL